MHKKKRKKLVAGLGQRLRLGLGLEPRLEAVLVRRFRVNLSRSWSSRHLSIEHLTLSMNGNRKLPLRRLERFTLD